MTENAENACPQADLVHSLAVRALTNAEAMDVAGHLRTCESCRRDLSALQSVVASFVDWETDILRPVESLWNRLSDRIAGDPEKRPSQSVYDVRARTFGWKQVAPGISCKLLATDSATGRVGMLVRLAAGMEYPPHRHAGREELHLLHGELHINGKKFRPGDNYVAEAGTSDTRVWTETGCTCVLVTSLRDQLH